MNQDANIAAIFDLDGTLFKGHLWHGIVKYHIKSRVKSFWVLNYLCTNIPIWFAAKCKILTEEFYKVRWGEDLAGAFKGLYKEEGHKIFEWIRDNYIMRQIRDDIIALLNQHKKEGHTIILLSGGLYEFMETLKQKLNVDHVVGTKLEIIKNIYSGRIVKPLCIGKNKASTLKEFINREHLNINLDRSYVYTDSIVDAPVLEMVGNPVATYPDKKLLNLALRKGWQILPSH